MQESEIVLYRPSNGTEGESFFYNWCRHCAREKAMREDMDIDECDDNELCEIIAKTMAFDIDDPGYPREWCYDKEGCPQCTSFIQAGEPIPLKDDLTLDMFTNVQQ